VDILCYPKLEVSNRPNHYLNVARLLADADDFVIKAPLIFSFRQSILVEFTI
jgi:hypothetical protein